MPGKYDIDYDINHDIDHHIAHDIDHDIDYDIDYDIGDVCVACNGSAFEKTKPIYWGEVVSGGKKKKLRSAKSVV